MEEASIRQSESRPKAHLYITDTTGARTETETMIADI